MLIFLDRFLQFHPAAHQRDRSEDHSEGSAAGDCAPTGFRRYDIVADHHQHLRTSKKKEAEGYQHLRRCCQATPGEQKDPCADWCWGMHVLWYYAVVLLELPLNEHILLSECLNAFFFSCRCPFHVEYQIFDPEMGFMHDLLLTFLIFQIPKQCLTLITLDETQDPFSSLLRFVHSIHRIWFDHPELRS